MFTLIKTTKTYKLCLFPSPLHKGEMMEVSALQGEVKEFVSSSNPYLPDEVDRDLFGNVVKVVSYVRV